EDGTGIREVLGGELACKMAVGRIAFGEQDTHTASWDWACWAHECWCRRSTWAAASEDGGSAFTLRESAPWTARAPDTSLSNSAAQHARPIPRAGAPRVASGRADYTAHREWSPAE